MSTAIVIILAVLFFILIILIIARLWKSLNEQRIKDIAKVGFMADYVKFIANFKQAEKHEKTGADENALVHYKAALDNLEKIEDKDKMVEENIFLLKKKIKKLDKT